MSDFEKYTKKFNDNGYIYIPDFLDKKDCEKFTTKLFLAVKNNQTEKDEQCPLSEAIYGLPVFDKLLEHALPFFEKYSGFKLYPTYTYARLYKPGDELKNHRDRPACEISVTITLGYIGKKWPIYMGDLEDKSNSSEILMNVGDAVLYKGLEKWHWREKYEEDKNSWLAQVFLHYVNANGPNAEWKYDKREKLAHM